MLLSLRHLPSVSLSWMHRVPSSGWFSWHILQVPPQGGRQCNWTDIAILGGEGSSPWCCISFVHREGERSLSLTMKALEFGDREPSGGRTQGLPSCPIRWVSHDVDECPVLLFGSQEVFGSHAAWSVPLRDPPGIGGPCLPWSGAVRSSRALGAQLQHSSWSRSCPLCWAITGNPWYLGYKTPIVDPEPSIKRVAGVSRFIGWHNMSTHGTVKVTAAHGNTTGA
jgi:hypothetical protein